MIQQLIDLIGMATANEVVTAVNYPVILDDCTWFGAGHNRSSLDLVIQFLEAAF